MTVIRIHKSMTIRAALSKLPAPAMAWMLERGWVTDWPHELTRRGRRSVRVIYV